MCFATFHFHNKNIYTSSYTFMELALSTQTVVLLEANTEDDILQKKLNEWLGVKETSEVKNAETEEIAENVNDETEEINEGDENGNGAEEGIAEQTPPSAVLDQHSPGRNQTSDQNDENQGFLNQGFLLKHMYFVERYFNCLHLAKLSDLRCGRTVQ